MREGTLKAGLSYQCQSCQELFERVPQGVCPICGSEAVVPFRWYQVSAAKRQAWLTRIHGGHKKKTHLSHPAPAMEE